LEGSGSGLIEVLFRNFPEVTEENREIPVRIDGVPAEIRTEHLPNTSQELHKLFQSAGGSVHDDNDNEGMKFQVFMAVEVIMWLSRF
jgi:hypothetical protein